MISSAEISLLRVARSTFEDLGFLLVELELRDDQRAAELEGAVSVGFEGSLGGRVEVRTFGGVLPVLTMNMLGEGGFPSRRLQHDALGEVANVICGNVLPLLAGPREVFRLSAPAPAPDPAAAPTATAVLGVERGRAEVLLFAEPSSARDTR